MVNGTQSEKIDMCDGLGQGDALSPLLFNLFIESLARMLKTTKGLNGVTLKRMGTQHHPDAADVNVKVLMYADDVAVIAEYAEQLQLALDTIGIWCDKWDMQLGIGTQKTAAMYLPANQPKTEQPNTKAAVPKTELQVTFNNTRYAVPWTTEYKYLGLRLKFHGPQ